MTSVRVVHYVEHVVTGSPACGASLGLAEVATSTRTQVTCSACLAVLAGVDDQAAVCTSCDLPRDHPGVAHRPTQHAVWCVWTHCGHNVSRGDAACTEEHPQEGTPVPEPTENKPPAKKAARKAAAPPPPERPDGEELFTAAQRRRLEALTRAARLLDDGETRGTAGELLTLARWIEGDPIDQPDDGGPGLTFVGAPTTPSTTNTEGATQ